ncbi:hypothetical protein GC097_01725 [Paenibacillus sp. LMG 31457]|uniref:Uncharacterized protein n=2 Tax=Paenibacillus planticolens TaxID=2654976 RepID=A0ABX1ZF88_9BACL|nr:hypothetical protein [Paenibacillus planticolens]
MTIIAAVICEDTSVPIEVTVGTAKRTEKPTVTGDIYTNFFRISGNTVPGMTNKWTYVYLKKQDGTYVTSRAVAQEGSFWAYGLLENPVANLTEGEELQLTAKATEAAFSGWAEPGAFVSFRALPSGFSSWLIASSDGSFSFSMFPAGYLHAGDQIKVNATSFGKATSDLVYLTLEASPKTAAPTVTGVVYTNGFMLQGTLNSELSYTNMTLTNKYDSIVGSFGTGWDRNFSTSQLFQSYVHLKAGDVVELRAQVNGMTRSNPVPFVVQATKGQTEVPTINDDILETESFNGIAEPGAIVTLTNDTTGSLQTAVAAADGSYSFYWYYKGYRIGDQLSLEATVPGKETSDTVQITLIASP